MEINSLRFAYYTKPNLATIHEYNYWKVIQKYPRASFFLTLSWRWQLSYRNQSIDLLCKSMDWFLYDSELRQERVNNTHCMKSVQIRSFFWSVFSCIQTRKNSVFGNFSRKDCQLYLVNIFLHFMNFPSC